MGSESYRGWHIAYDPPPIPVRTCDWQFWHDDFDGAEDSGDNRYGHASSLEAAKAEIDAWEADHGYPTSWGPPVRLSARGAEQANSPAYITPRRVSVATLSPPLDREAVAEFLFSKLRGLGHENLVRAIADELTTGIIALASGDRPSRGVQIGATTCPTCGTAHMVAEDCPTCARDGRAGS